MKPTVSESRACAAAAEPPAAGAGVERREQLVLDQHAGLGQRVHQRALAGVGVADQRDRGHVAAAGDLALLPRLDLGQLRLELLDPVPDQPAVFLELLLARAPHADAALVPRQVGPHPLEPGHRVFELRQLDLEMRLVRLRVGGEDVEDHLGAVDHLDLELLLEVARLGRAQVVVEDDDVGLLGLDDRLELLDLARADVGGDVDLRAASAAGCPPRAGRPSWPVPGARPGDRPAADRRCGRGRITPTRMARSRRPERSMRLVSIKAGFDLVSSGRWTEWTGRLASRSHSKVRVFKRQRRILASASLDTLGAGMLLRLDTAGHRRGSGRRRPGPRGRSPGRYGTH